MEKNNLRKDIIKQLQSLTEEEKTEIENQIHTTLLTSNMWRNANRIGITISREGIEWDTKKIIEQAWKEAKRVAVPKCIQETKAMQFYDFQSYEELEVVYYGLQEPIPREDRLVDKNEMDLLVVPGVVFDKVGYRVGFGGGYYDRFLADYRHTTVSLVSNVQLVSEVPREEHDIAVDYLITEHKVM